MINKAGEIVGMSCYYDEDLAIISVTTIRTCIMMWDKFGFILLFLFFTISPLASLDEFFSHRSHR